MRLYIVCQMMMHRNLTPIQRLIRCSPFGSLLSSASTRTQNLNAKRFRRRIYGPPNYSLSVIIFYRWQHRFQSRWCDMAHEIKLETVTNKAAQLNALLFTISGEFTGNPITDNLIELAHELSDSVACWLIEENAQRKES